MKRVLCIAAIAAILVSALSVTAFAHGGHHGGAGRTNSRQNAYAHCTVDDCDTIGVHRHSGAWYCDQEAYCGQELNLCAVEDCTELRIHEHDGAYYRCADNGSRRGCGGGRHR